MVLRYVLDFQAVLSLCMLFALSVFLLHAAVKTLLQMQAFVYGVDTGCYR